MKIVKLASALFKEIALLMMYTMIPVTVESTWVFNKKNR